MSGVDDFEIILGDLPADEITKEKVISEANNVYLGKFNSREIVLKLLTEKGKHERNGELLRSFHHENLVEIIGYVALGPEAYLVMEYFPLGTLWDQMMLRDQYISKKNTIKWAHEIAIGMEYLHERKCMHRDLKPTNILISQNSDGTRSAKIGDYGFVKEYFATISKSHTNCCTMRYAAPEVLSHNKYSKYVDIWSYGVTIWSMLTEEKPYNHIEDDIVIPYQIVNGLKLAKLTNLPEFFENLIQICTLPNKNDRYKKANFKKIVKLFESIPHEFIYQSLVCLSEEEWVQLKPIWSQNAKEGR